MERYLGKHMVLDAECVSRRGLNDMDGIYELLGHLPEKIGMTPISPPYMVKYKEIPDLEWGFSGVILIAESHISIHTFPEKRRFSFDCFSCKDFDADQVMLYLERFFRIKEYKLNILER